MERKNGYLKLNDFFEKLKEEKNCQYFNLLVDGIIVQSDYDDRHFWLNIDGITYYYKPSHYAYHELLAYYIAEELGFNAVYCDLAMFSIIPSEAEDNKGIISQSYKKPNCQYISGIDILKEYYEGDPRTNKEMGLTDEWKAYYNGPYYIDMNNLETIWQALEYRYKNNPNADITKLIDQIINNYIFEVLVRANDKGSQNWEIEESENDVNVCPLFDNELIFYDSATMTMSASFNDSEKDVKESLKKFLTISSQEYINLFINKFNAFDDNMFYSCIEKVESQTGTKIPEIIKEEIINAYNLNKLEINALLKELNLTNKRR